MVFDDLKEAARYVCVYVCMYVRIYITKHTFNEPWFSMTSRRLLGMCVYMLYVYERHTHIHLHTYMLYVYECCVCRCMCVCQRMNIQRSFAEREDFFKTIWRGLLVPCVFMLRLYICCVCRCAYICMRISIHRSFAERADSFRMISRMLLGVYMYVCAYVNVVCVDVCVYACV